MEKMPLENKSRQGDPNKWDPKEYERALARMEDGVKKAVKCLKEEGYNFELHENPNDYEIVIKDIPYASHISKVGHVDRNDGTKQTVGEALEMRIRQVYRENGLAPEKGK